ncbi:hypothetical protein [Streptomyces sp. NPDC004134]|uniref:hypothetical protein n=1 Tax=Streptomyces sp. NPDC004134 TaxID=3364691 RepID=UPI00368D54D3
MRKFHAALVGAVMTVTASTMLTGLAEAAPAAPLGPNCDREYHKYKGDGYLRIYDGVDCTEYLDRAATDDFNWGDSAAPVESHANDRATSLLNTGTYAGGIHNIQFWEHKGRVGGTGCLAWEELYISDLRDDDFAGVSTANANQAISSHHWRSSCTNPWT